MSRIEKFEYSFKGKIWKHKESGGWHFVTLPKRLSKEIRETHYVSEEGWGRLKVKASFSQSGWETSIWYDSKIGSYIIPIKSVIRKKESLAEGDRVEIHLVLHREKWLSKLTKK